MYGGVAAGVAERAEVVHDLVVVPDADVARARQQTLGRRVGPVVAPVRPERREVGRGARPRHLRVAVTAERIARVVGVDHVAEADEDVRPQAADRLHDREALARVAADVLAGDVAAEGEAHRFGVVRGGRGLEGAALEPTR